MAADIVNPMGAIQDAIDITLMFEQPIADVGACAGQAYQSNEAEVNSWIADKLVNLGYLANMDLRPAPFGPRFDHIPAVYQY